MFAPPLMFATHLTALIASAQPSISYQYSQVTSPEGDAYLVVQADAPVAGIDVVIEGSDGFRLKKRVAIGNSGEAKVTWRQKGPQVHYRAQLITDEPVSEFEFDIRKPAAAGKHGKLEVKSSALDIVELHRVRYQTSFAFDSYTFQVWGIDGQKIDEQERSGVAVPAGGTIDLAWNSDDDVFMLSMRAQDEAGRFAEDKVVPWSVEIPHTDVTFQSGRWEIRNEQKPRLDEAFAVLAHELDRLERANAAVNGDIKAQLYVVGYTDTVDDAASNLKLSENRARAIADYFSQAGAWCEIWYAGMGERGLAVPTPDNTDMEANRRAVYVVGVDKPQGPKMPGAGGFRKLSEARPRRLDALPELPAAYHEHQEKVRAERIRKRGGPAGDQSSTASDSSVDGGEKPDKVDLHGDREVDTSFEGLAGDEAAQQPRGSSSGKPGATAKGCQVAPNSAKSSLWASLLMGLALVHRARRRLV